MEKIKMQSFKKEMMILKDKILLKGEKLLLWLKRIQMDFTI
jgi:hypothetical protein